MPTTSEHSYMAARVAGEMMPSKSTQVGTELSAADVERIYRSLQLIRRTEEEVAKLYPSDVIRSPVHLSIGQEAVSVGICDQLRADDAVSPTYRGHAAYIAKGGPLRQLLAELYGKST